MTTTSTPTRPGPGYLTHTHRAEQGFCSVCGSVWPCWRARRSVPAATSLTALT